MGHNFETKVISLLQVTRLIKPTKICGAWLSIYNLAIKSYVGMNENLEI